MSQSGLAWIELLTYIIKLQLHIDIHLQTNCHQSTVDQSKIGEEKSKKQEKSIKMPPRPNKRARLSETSTPKPSPSPPPSPQPSSKEDTKHTLFTTWAKSRGVQINSVAPQHLPNRGLGLLTTAPIKAGTRLLFVPEKAMFKPVPSTLQSATRARKSSTPASPQAQLSISALEKFTTGSSTTDVSDSSNLQTWQATWPTMQDFTSSMPLCWPEKLTTHLPPAVQAPLERQRADYARDWDAMSAYCAERGWGEGEFRYFWCIVNSRSFHWKPLTGGGGRAGSMVLCPFVDYMNHGPTGVGCRVVQGVKGYEVWAERDYGELFSCSIVRVLVLCALCCRFRRCHPWTNDSALIIQGHE